MDILEVDNDKVRQEQMACAIANTSQSPIVRQLAKAISMSNRLMAEDLLREAGYMLPQSQNVKTLLQILLDGNSSEDFPEEVVKRLLNILNDNKEEEKMDHTKTDSAG